MYVGGVKKWEEMTGGGRYRQPFFSFFVNNSFSMRKVGKIHDCYPIFSDFTRVHKFLLRLRDKSWWDNVWWKIPLLKCISITASKKLQSSCWYQMKWNEVFFRNIESFFSFQSSKKPTTSGSWEFLWIFFSVITWKRK